MTAPLGAPLARKAKEMSAAFCSEMNNPTVSVDPSACGGQSAEHAFTLPSMDRPRQKTRVEFIFTRSFCDEPEGRLVVYTDSTLTDIRNRLVHSGALCRFEVNESKQNGKVIILGRKAASQNPRAGRPAGPPLSHRTWAATGERWCETTET